MSLGIVLEECRLQRDGSVGGYFGEYPLPSRNGIEYVTLFLANFDLPPSVTLCHTSRDPRKYVTHLGPPIFSRPSTKIPEKVLCTNSISLVLGGFCPGFLSGLVFVHSPFVRIHLLHQKVKHNFKFHVSYV